MSSQKYIFKVKQYANFLFIILAILFQTLSGISGKYASIAIINLSPVSIISNVFYWISILCMILQTVVWLQALKHYPLSFAYPLMSLINFSILVSSYILFHESISMMNILGLALISIGVYFMAMEVK